MEKLNELKKEYKKIVAEQYLDKKIDYSSGMDYGFKGLYSFGGYYEGTFRKGFVSDVDDTLTIGESLTKKWVDGLSEINRLIRRIREELLQYLGKILFLDPALDKLTIKQTVEMIGKKFKECKLHYKEHREASAYAAREIKLAPHSRDLIHGLLERMGYAVSLNSGSPEECVELLGQRLGIPKRGIGWLGVYKAIFGSRYKFEDGDGYFTGEIVPGLDFNKEIGMKKFLKNINCPHGLSIFMSDDPKLEKGPASMAGLTIWTVNRSLLDRLFGYKFPGEIKVTCPDAKKDMSILLNYIEKWDLINVVTYLRTPETEMEIYNLAKKFKNIYENGLKSKENLYIYKTEFLSLAHQLLSLVGPIVTEKSLNVFGSLHDLEDSDDIESVKSLMKDIFSRFSYRIPEIQASEKLGKELKRIVEEKQLFEDLDWWFP